MPLPEIKRTHYNNNPLDKVVAQLRYPPILKIDTVIPAEFQEKLRSSYPNLVESKEVLFDIKLNTQQKVSEELPQLSSSMESNNYEFSSEDNLWKVNLTRKFIALSTSNYQRWEEFKDRFQTVVQVLMEIYKPASFSRTGLRYTNIIVRSKIELPDEDWDSLISSYLLGVMASEELKTGIELYENVFGISLEDNGSKVKVINKTVRASDSKELCYMIDSDFFCPNKKNYSEAFEKLDFFNGQAGRLFKWCITKKLHSAMEPTEI